MPSYHKLRVEDLVDQNAYEAHMHFLLPYGGYRTELAALEEPTIEAVETFLAHEQLSNKAFFWVNFVRYEYAGPAPCSAKQRIRQHKVGQQVIAALPYAQAGEPRFVNYDAAVKESAVTPYTALLAGLYARGHERHPNGLKLRPTDLIQDLYHHPLLRYTPVLDLKLEAFRSETLPERYARLAQHALVAHPELISWIDTMGVELHPKAETIDALVEYDEAFMKTLRKN